MNEPFFSQEIPSRLDAVSGLLDETAAALLARGFLTAERSCRLRLCLEEALVNAVRHGNRGNEELRVRLELHDKGDGCLIRIYDCGCGFDPQRVQMSKPDQAGGRGVCLIRHFMDRVAYNDSEKCLELWLHRHDCHVEVQSNE
jgi:serine/threonine-protein kinase RsbW/non-specific serine/threonine protein kinase